MARKITLWVEDGPKCDGYAEKRHFYDVRMTHEACAAEIERIRRMREADMITVEYTGKRQRGEKIIQIKPDTRPELKAVVTPADVARNNWDGLANLNTKGE